MDVLHICIVGGDETMFVRVFVSSVEGMFGTVSGD